jgi:hypothetical protein
MMDNAEDRVGMRPECALNMKRTSQFVVDRVSGQGEFFEHTDTPIIYSDVIIHGSLWHVSTYKVEGVEPDGIEWSKRYVVAVAESDRLAGPKQSIDKKNG